MPLSARSINCIKISCMSFPVPVTIAACLHACFVKTLSILCASSKNDFSIGLLLNRIRAFREALSNRGTMISGRNFELGCDLAKSSRSDRARNLKSAAATFKAFLRESSCLFALNASARSLSVANICSSVKSSESESPELSSSMSCCIFIAALRMASIASSFASASMASSESSSSSSSESSLLEESSSESSSSSSISSSSESSSSSSSSSSPRFSAPIFSTTLRISSIPRSVIFPETPLKVRSVTSRNNADGCARKAISKSLRTSIGSKSCSSSSSCFLDAFLVVFFFFGGWRSSWTHLGMSSTIDVNCFGSDACKTMSVFIKGVIDDAMSLLSAFCFFSQSFKAFARFLRASFARALFGITSVNEASASNVNTASHASESASNFCSSSFSASSSSPFCFSPFLIFSVCCFCCCVRPRERMFVNNIPSKRVENALRSVSGQSSMFLPIIDFGTCFLDVE